jgi:alkyldihydroxyacetonephosphate synthase
LLIEVDARTTLAGCEETLAKEGLTLGVGEAADPALDFGTWLARGAPGARDAWSDPADHLVAGLDVRLVGGERLSIRPAPRRAVGPDLIALVVGLEGRFGKVERAWIRVHRRDAPAPATHPLVADRNPPMTDGEGALFDAIERALRT